MSSALVFVDRLSVWSLLHLAPSAAMSMLLKRQTFIFRYFEKTISGSRLLRVFTLLGFIRGTEADYSWQEVRNPEGLEIGYLIDFIDTLGPCDSISETMFETDRFISRFGNRFDRNSLVLYLKKALHDELRPIFYRILTVSWFQREERLTTENSDLEQRHARSTLVLQRTPWLQEIADYAHQNKVELRGYTVYYHHPKLPLRLIFKLLSRISIGFIHAFSPVRIRRQHTKSKTITESAQSPPFSVAVPDVGNGLSLDLSENTELFWVPFANLSPEQLLVYSIRSDEKLDHDKYNYLRNCEFQSVAIARQAIASPSLPFWPTPADFLRLMKSVLSDWQILGPFILGQAIALGSHRWIGIRLLSFLRDYYYWWGFFSSYHIRVNVDVGDMSKTRIAADQAIADLDGLSITYQRSYEPFAGLIRSSSVDVHFAFSENWAPNEKLSGSNIAQYISYGYTRDHAFQSILNRASDTRRQLINNGARFLVSYFDEGAQDDKRVGPSHEYRNENYRFLLQKLLDDPSMGLIIKPKSPGSIRNRLGEIDELLQAALDTGRCHLYGGNASTPALPCEAGSAADVSIGLLYGGTASLEVALSGGRSLLIDREVTTRHPLYRLEEGQVVFQDWDSLWKALTTFRADPSSMPRFGDWGDQLNFHDSFRDGNAARRMGEYICWLCEGLTDGLSRYEALELARNRYITQWGENTVISIRP